MKAVVTVVGRDTVGILAKVSTVCAEHKAVPRCGDQVSP
jgi:predicted amino acid-binding ACT domain protein